MNLDDLIDYNEELSEAVKNNTRRYTNIVSDLVYEMLPDYKQREVSFKQFSQDLDVNVQN